MSTKYGFRHKRNEEIKPRWCDYCEKLFRSRNPTKRFCCDVCRIKNWTKYNKDKIAIIQKNCRRNQKADLSVEE